MSKQINIRLPDEIDERLESLAERTGNSKTYYVKQAISVHLDDLEDIYIAGLRLARPEKTYTLVAVEKQLELGD